MILRVPLILLLAALEPSDAWVVRAGVPNNHGRARKTATTAFLPVTTTTTKTTTTAPTATLLRMSKNPPSDGDDDDEDEEDCDDEEECEIDWDKMMPPTDELSHGESSSVSMQSIKEQLERQFAASASSATAAATTTSTNSNSVPAVERRGDSRRPVTGATLRNRLEMQWQVTEHAQDDECDVYQPATCGGQTCTICQGRGHCACRFCRGARALQLRTVHDDGRVELNLVQCQICNASGYEICRSCQGSGWIADWTGIGGGVHVGGGGGNGWMP